MLAFSWGVVALGFVLGALFGALVLALCIAAKGPEGGAS